MDFKKCSRCGCFFLTANDVCCKCESKDMLDISKLTSITKDNCNFNSVQDLSIFSGISINNLNRFITKNIININFKL